MKGSSSVSFFLPAWGNTFCGLSYTLGNHSHIPFLVLFLIILLFLPFSSPLPSSPLFSPPCQHPLPLTSSPPLCLSFPFPAPLLPSLPFLLLLHFPVLGLRVSTGPCVYSWHKSCFGGMTKPAQSDNSVSREGVRMERKKTIRQHCSKTPASAEAGLSFSSQLLYHPRYLQRIGSVSLSYRRQSSETRQ